jgi:hypothetical protein
VTERARQAYLSIAGVMLAIGGAGLVLGLVDGAFSIGIFRGSPVLTAVFVLAIGAALRWTALSAEVRPDDAARDGGGPHDGGPHDDVADGDAPAGEDGSPPRA